MSPHDRVPTGPPPDADRQHGPPEGPRFEPLPGDPPGDQPGAPDPYPAAAPERPPDPPKTTSRTGASGRRKWLGFLSVLPVPLMPILALVIAVGIVSYALSTQQISLNFAGGAPQKTQTDQRDSQVSRNNPGERTGRADGLIIAFRVASRTPGGFKATATIANKGSQPVPRWALAFKIPSASVTAVSGATVVRTGEIAFVRGRAPLAPGARVRIVFAAQGTAARPSSCILNSRPCAIV
ncbi:hypothetical protein E1281_28470 [Actinomadura sp. KC345]|uniref:cellulose binding domain-containing protein n=1 Tax=Actinomadura sp. KC345 TaxID=2530371 RepID=UPI0010467C16|nr:cellulose binding domain-containing protein [Actinomadura sp. KC345]TDC46188.1 hypothetical protein E1281_28470 [Actinomadura sp. KC345]